MRWSWGYFGVKDLFTIINLMGGVVGAAFAVLATPETAYLLDWAGIAIMLGFFLGDSLDGLVARATKTGNRFGAEFDAQTDHFAQVVAPALVLYKAYVFAGHPHVGMALFGWMILSATLRGARFGVAPFHFPLAYCGLPRTINGFVCVAFPQATLYWKLHPQGWLIGIVVVGLVGLLNLLPIPYMTHKGRKMQGYVKLAVVVFILMPVVLFVVARPFVWDFIFFFSFGYALGAWIPIYPDERRAFYAEYRRWRAAVVAAR